ncbi:LysR family transcriptional regulator [Vibrio aestuarianus]|uniref:LysR family transcriptional regulator n=1 Tax=Vibrio aestuarianus TaxID=28171 RepID=UPI00237CD922|nr:LysR family transcriptional regulator [Vibrio aestuarianus]MDE1330422.1 LysR family transcriptional regulator [Vibrio aestuarianus]
MGIKKLTGIDRVTLLQTWVRIVEAGNLTLAAQQLKTTQPTVTRRLQSLELVLNCKLLLRTTHQLKLTEEGESCYQYAKTLLNNWGELEESVGKAAYNEVNGTLRVKAPHAFGQQQLIRPLIDYLEQNSGMHIDWILNDKTPDFLGNNFDCAIHVGKINEANVVAKQIAYVPRILVATPTLVENMGETPNVNNIHRWPWVALSTYYRDNIILNHMKTEEQRELRLNPLISTDNIFFAQECVLNHLGVASLSTWLVEPYLSSGKLVQIIPYWQEDAIPMYIVYPYANYYPKRLINFIKIMQQSICKVLNVVSPPFS